jgi:hypothetical protein
MDPDLVVGSYRSIGPVPSPINRPQYAGVAHPTTIVWSL